MKQFLLIALCLGLLATHTYGQNLQSDTMYVRCTQTLDFAAAQANRMIPKVTGTQLPNCLNSSGALVTVAANNWTSGFFPGELWYLSKYKNDATMQTNAKKYTQLLVDQQYNTATHDVGFIMYCSYGKGLEFANVAGYKDILVQTASSLMTRYNPTVGCTRSWNNYTFPVIIDNMMNLELLVWATRVTGDSSYHKAAVSHAEKTLKNHFRPDYSSYHLVDYNPNTGAVIGKQTVQGYSNSSSWARGQAWGLYGYTFMYTWTKNNAFLVHAKHIADYVIQNLPPDYVTYYDYSDPAIPNVPRDASAAALTASALLELYRLTNIVSYLRVSEKILWNLSQPKYMNAANESQNFLLKHSTGSNPSNSQVDVPIIYADYYFVEALYRYVNIRQTTAGIKQVAALEASLEVYPIPFGQTLTVKLPVAFDKIEIVDIAGRTMIASKFEPTDAHVLQLTNQLNTGVYFLKVYAEGKYLGSKKIFK